MGYNGVRIERFSEGVAHYGDALRNDILSAGSEAANPDRYALVSGSAAALVSVSFSLGASYKALSSTMLAVIDATKASPTR